MKLIAYFVKTSFRQGFVYFAIFGLVVAPTGAPLAQSERRATSLEEVVVTAQKREESLQDAPISLSVFGEDALEDIGVSEFGQVAEFTPNLSIRKQPASMDNYGIGIRGVVAGETSLIVDPRVGVYIDGIYLGRSTGMAFDINDLERIEVLRGPQGTLYGRNTIGGAINIVTAQPDGEFNFKQKLSMGQGGLFESRTSVELDAVDMGAYGRLLSSFTYLLNEHDGLVENSADGRLFGESEAEALRVALRWEYGDALTVDYRFDMSERDNYPDVSQITHVRGSRQLGGPISRAAIDDADSDRRSVITKYIGRSSDNDGSYSDIEGHSLIVEWDTGAWGVLKSITGMREWDHGTDTTDFGSWQFTSAQLDGKLWRLDALGQLETAPAGPYPLFDAELFAEQEQFSQEFQLVGDMMGGDLEYTLGVFYFEEEVIKDNPQRFTLVAPFSGLHDIGVTIPPEWGAAVGTVPAGMGHDVLLTAPFFHYGQDVESQGLYGQIRWQMSDRSHWTFGLRYTEEEKDAFLENAPTPQTDLVGGVLAGDIKADINAALCQGPGAAASAMSMKACARVESDNSWDNLQGFVNFSYDLSDYINVYLTASSGYGSGGFNARTSLNKFSDPYDEETLENLEIGWKYQSDDNRTRFNGAAFLMQYKDRQIDQFGADSGGASSFISNAGEQLQRGVEFELTRIINEGLRMSLTYSYLDVDFESFRTGVFDPVTGFPVLDENFEAVTADLATSEEYAATATHSPKHTASLQLNYDFETLPIGDLSFWLGASYSTNIVYHPQLNLYDATGEYMLINLRLTLDVETGGAVPGDLQASFWAKNIRDKEVRGWGIDFGALGFTVNTYEDVGSLGFDLVWNY